MLPHRLLFILEMKGYAYNILAQKLSHAVCCALYKITMHVSKI